MLYVSAAHSTSSPTFTRPRNRNCLNPSLSLIHALGNSATASPLTVDVLGLLSLHLLGEPSDTRRVLRPDQRAAMVHISRTTLGSELTRSAYLRSGPILVRHDCAPKIPAFVPQDLSSRTTENILLRIVDKLLRIKLLSYAP